MTVKPCLDCGTLTAGSRCPACTAANKRRVEAQRDSSAERGYGWAWSAISRKVIAAQPWCSICGHTGSPTNPLTADHIIPKAHGGTDALGNLRTLCRFHNSSRSHLARRPPQRPDPPTAA